MYILVIDNASLSIINGSYCTNKFNTEFIRELVSFGNKVNYCHFATAKKNKDSISTSSLSEVGAKALPIKIHKIKIWQYICAFFVILFAIFHSDFVYFYFPNSFIPMARLCQLIGKPYGLYIRGMSGVTKKRSMNLYKGATAIFTVADYFTDYVNKITHSYKAHTIRPMIPYTYDDILIDRHYKPARPLKVLFLGRYDKEKGLNELLQAVSKVDNIHLTLVGVGDYRSELEHLITRYNIFEKVSLNGAVTDDTLKRKIYLDSDIYILPTYHEGFPRTLYEAMMMGTPIITTMVGGIPSLMKDHMNCYMIEPHSVDSIINGLKFALSNYDVMVKYAEAATTTIKKVLNPSRPSHAEHLFQELCISVNNKK